MNKKVAEWSETYVPQFNALSEKYDTSFYSQSPLDQVEENADLMIIGINPKGALKNGKTVMSSEQFLSGNPCWKERFVDGVAKWKFVDGARHFMGYDKFIHKESIDNDSRVVWTNLSPFQSEKGFTDLPKELKEIGIKSTLDLIKAVRPKRIVLLGGNAFNEFDKNKDCYEEGTIEHTKVFENLSLEIGRIFNTPTVYANHPSGQWAVSNKFTSVFMLLHKLTDTVVNNKPVHSLQEVRQEMRKEVKLWQTRIVIDDKSI